MRLKRVLAALFIAVMVFSLSACNSSLALFINTKAGDSYNYHIVVKNTTDMEAEGETIKTTQDMTTDYIVTVDDVDSEGIITMRYKYDALKVESESNGVKQTYDSKNVDVSDPTAGIYNSMIGKGFTTKMTKYGEIKEVNGVDELLNSMVGSIETGGDETMEAVKQQLKENLKESFGDEAIISTLQQSTKIFPENNINVGDSWDINYNLKSFIDLNMKATYTLEKVEGETAYVSIKADYNTDSSKPGKFMGMDMNADLSGTMTGNLKINTNNGFLSEGEINQDMTGKMNLEIPDQETIEVPLKSNSEISYSSTRL